MMHILRIVLGVLAVWLLIVCPLFMIGWSRALRDRRRRGGN